MMNISSDLPAAINSGMVLRWGRQLPPNLGLAQIFSLKFYIGARGNCP